MSDQFSGFRDTTWVRGESNPNFKGNAAGVQAKRVRAHKFPLKPNCEECGAPAIDRHHKDGDVGNNEESNIAHLCRKCHMLADGRLDRLAHGPKYVSPLRPCIDCMEPSKPLRRGRCHKCNERFRRASRIECHLEEHNGKGGE